MRILLLAPFDLFPPVHGGSSIVYNFIRHACTRHEVTALISHLYSRGGQIDLPVDRVHIHYCPSSLFDRLRVFSFLVNLHYYHAAEQMFRQSQPAVIQCEILWTTLAGWWLQRKHRVPLIWVEHNTEALKYADMGYPSALVAAIRWVERFACRHAEHIIVLSETDRQKLVQMYGADVERITVITPGPDLSEFTFDETARTAIRDRYGLAPDDALLTFVGNLQYEPNQQALRRIAEYIYPAVMARHPTARFVVIGQGAENLADCRREHIIFTGYLSRQELVAHLCATDIFLVPVETGSGIRVKIPEATACARAVVATRKAAQGLESFQDDEIVRVEGVGPQFNAAVLQLIENPALRTAIGARAKARTIREFGWEKTLAAYEQVYAKVGALDR